MRAPLSSILSYIDAMKKALVFGATGLVGGHVVRLLQQDARYSEIHVFLRRSAPFEGGKVHTHVVDFTNLDEVRDSIQGNELFCCLGTTIKVAGSQAAFRFVDYELPVALAKIAAQQGVKSFLVVSAMGANSASSVFYNRVKGDMERDIAVYPNMRIGIAQPSLLLGERAESRLGERIGSAVMGFFDFMVPDKYKAIKGETVARALIAIANDAPKGTVFTSDVLTVLGAGKG